MKGGLEETDAHGRSSSSRGESAGLVPPPTDMERSTTIDTPSEQDDIAGSRYASHTMGDDHSPSVSSAHRGREIVLPPLSCQAMTIGIHHAPSPTGGDSLQASDDEDMKRATSPASAHEIRSRSHPLAIPTLSGASGVSGDSVASQRRLSAMSQRSDRSDDNRHLAVPGPNTGFDGTVDFLGKAMGVPVHQSTMNIPSMPSSVAPTNSRRSSRSTTMPSVGEGGAWRNNLHRPSVHSLHSVQSSSRARQKSLTSMDLATLETMSRRCVQMGVNDLDGAAQDCVDSSPAGIDKVVNEEKQRISTKVSSQAYENNMRGVMAEKKLMRSASKISNASSQAEKKLLRTPSIGSSQGGRPTPQTYGVEHLTKIAPAVGSDSDEEAAAQREILALHERMLKFVGWVSPIKWLATVVIAILIALQAGGIIHGTIRIVEWKVEKTAELSADGPGGQFYAFLVLLLYASPACFIGSWLVTYVAPHAGGSGIPEIKAFLNGIQMPKAFTGAAWSCRAVGLMLVTSSGLFAGTEGPFAHLGGITAKFFADGPPCLEGNCWPTVLQGHRNRCEFISQGAAMGVAAAFGAPIGGILFSLEEASSFWTKALTWRAFLGTVIAALLAKLARSGFTSFVVAGFISFPDKDASFSLWELLTFGPLALVSGLLGALFCNTVKRLLQFRRRFFKLGSPTKVTKLRRMLEVQFIVLFTLTVCFWPAAMLGCREVDYHADDVDVGHRLLAAPTERAADLAHDVSEEGPVGFIGSLVRRLSAPDEGPPNLVGGLCPQVNGRETYSDLGYILLSPKEKAIRTLFSKEMADGAYLSVRSLLIGWAICFFTTILTFGAAIPVGLFIPNILAGACLGRAFGQALLEFDLDVHPGVYALMGAAGALGGFSRMTISLAVIFLEITNNMNLLMPLMLVIMLSKVVADQFGPSVYDIVLEVNPDIHLLEDNLSEDHLLILEGLKVHDVCCREIVVLRQQESVDEIVLLLHRCKFGGFPIVDDEGVIAGLITRTQLVSILDTNKEGSEVINLLRYANTAPDITIWNTSVVHAFHHFRSSGLQHLCVVDQFHRVVGILTRTDFARLCHHGADAEEVRALIGKGNKGVSQKAKAFGWNPVDKGMQSSQEEGSHMEDQVMESRDEIISSHESRSDQEEAGAGAGGPT